MLEGRRLQRRRSRRRSTQSVLAKWNTLEISQSQGPGTKMFFGPTIVNKYT